MNGVDVLSNFDIFAQAGGEFVTVDSTSAVHVTNGQIRIQFSQSPADLPIVNAIQIAEI